MQGTCQHVAALAAPPGLRRRRLAPKIQRQNCDSSGCEQASPASGALSGETVILDALHVLAAKFTRDSHAKPPSDAACFRSLFEGGFAPRAPPT
jgi:hypothetical protein